MVHLLLACAPQPSEPAPPPTQADEAPPEPRCPVPAKSDLDPDRIASWLACGRVEITALWASLDIPAPLRLLEGAAGASADRCEPCWAKRDGMDLDAAPANEAVLTITNGGWYRFLVFDDGPAALLLGFADEVERPRIHPEIRPEFAGNRPYLVVHNLTASGTGLGLVRDRWYQVRDGRLMEVLDIPSSGGRCDGDDLCRELAVTHVGLDLLDDTLTFDFAVAWVGRGTDRVLGDGADWSEVPLFEHHQLAVHRWDGTRGRYILDPARSELSTEEVHDVFDLDRIDVTDQDVTCRTFFRFHRARLDALVRRSDARTARWAEGYQARCREALRGAARAR